MSVSKFIKVISDVSVIHCMFLPEYANGELTKLNMGGFMDGAEGWPCFCHCIAIDDVVDLIIGESNKNLFGGG